MVSFQRDGGSRSFFFKLCHPVFKCDTSDTAPDFPDEDYRQVSGTSGRMIIFHWWFLHWKGRMRGRIVHLIRLHNGKHDGRRVPIMKKHTVEGRKPGAERALFMVSSRARNRKKTIFRDWIASGGAHGPNIWCLFFVRWSWIVAVVDLRIINGPTIRWNCFEGCVHKTHTHKLKLRKNMQPVTQFYSKHPKTFGVLHKVEATNQFYNKKVFGNALDVQVCVNFLFSSVGK